MNKYNPYYALLILTLNQKKLEFFSFLLHNLIFQIKMSHLALKITEINQISKERKENV